LAEYCVAMADMGFGLTQEGIMAMAFAIVEKTRQNHPFKSDIAGRGWYEGFMACHDSLHVNENYFATQHLVYPIPCYLS